MRQFKITLGIIIFFAVLGGLRLAIAWHDPPSSRPLATITLIGYTIINVRQPDPNIFVFPGRGKWLEAKMCLTNEGSEDISYGAWGDEPYGWAKAQTDEGMTNGYLAPPFTGDTAVLRPGSSITFIVDLPTNTVKWQCGFDVATSSLRERAIWRILDSKLYRALPEFCFYPVQLLPYKEGPSVEVKSLMLQVTNVTSNAGRNNSKPTQEKAIRRIAGN